MIMKNQANLLIAAFFSILLYSSAYSSDETAVEKFSNIHNTFYSEQPITYYRVVYRRYDNFAPEEQVNRNKDPQDINEFIEKGCRQFPLPIDNDFILKDLEWHNEKDSIKEAINKVSRKDINAISYIGSIYMGVDEYEKAKPWLFYAAKESDSAAYWLLASLINLENLVENSSHLKNLEKNLLEKSAELGNPFAKESLGLKN